MLQAIVLDGRHFLDKEQAHDYMANIFGFPHYYGKNLDALYDLLSTYNQNEKLLIIVIYPEVILDNLGHYGIHLIQTFLDAAKENHQLDVRIRQLDEVMHHHHH